MAAQLSAAQCMLLTVHFASEANIRALHTFTPSRLDVLDPELVLRILLTYLPESVDPALYTTYVGEVASRIYLEQQEAFEVDISSVKEIAEEQAQKRAGKIQAHLLELSPPAFPGPPDAPKDALSRFLCHRAHRIDSQTGLLDLIPPLVEPFLEHNDYLRTWFVSIVLPPLRMSYDGSSGSDSGHELPMTLEDFEKLDGTAGINVLLSRTARHSASEEDDGRLAGDLRTLVGPWMYGHTERKRRRLDWESRRPRNSKDIGLNVPLGPITEDDKTGHDWEYAYRWMVLQAVQNFPLVTNAFEEWDGPTDIDLGGYVDSQTYLDKDTQDSLQRQYAQAAFATCYVVESDTASTIDGVHAVLARLAEILDFEPPPDLATSVQQLPRIDRHAELLHKTDSTDFLEPDKLLRPEHPLTTPKLEAFMLLQMLVYSAYQLAGLGHATSVVNVAKLRFFSDEDEQLALLQKILHHLASKGKRDEQQWQFDYDRIIWLWHWNIESDENALRGAGIFGKIDRVTIEKEIMKVLVSCTCYGLVDRLYIEDAQTTRVTRDDVQKVILHQAMQWYDGASNGNRTRGSMKKASDLIVHYQRHFAATHSFHRASSLIAATHALSFYSLTLQHGVPFQPVNIRVSQDPLALLPKVLEQNPHSYTKSDDLVSIGRNLVSAGLPLRTLADGELVESKETNAEIAAKLQTAERRVIAMCVEAALTEDDFETAYSYIVNRLAPPDPTLTISTPSLETTPEDDHSWRTAFLAGRYRPRTQTQSSPNIRRLQQRTELLSLSLLLAPPQYLSEILGVWRRCEEETAALLAADSAAEQSFDDRADRRHDVPGGFSDPSTEGMVFGQQRREVGRVGTSATTDAEAPMGLFDVARGAAKAFSRNAFPLRGAVTAPAQVEHSIAADRDGMAQEAYSHSHQRSGSSGSAGLDRVRKRDMVASAVTGGLASGIGWVLGATPVEKRAGDVE